MENFFSNRRRTIIVVVCLISMKDSWGGLANEENIFGEVNSNGTSIGGTVRTSPSKIPEITNTELQHENTMSKLERQRQRASSQATKVLTHKTTNVDVNVQLIVYPVTSTSVGISWNATVNRFYVNHYLTENFKNVGLKIIYRPFGGVLESEIILLMEAADNQASFNFSSEYSIENLLPNNGYIFCFSITLQNEDAAIIHDVEKEMIVIDEPKVFPNRPKPSIGFDEENIEDHLYFPSKDFTFGYVPTSPEQQQPPSSDHNIRQPINPLLSSFLQKSPESFPNRKQNVAYSSTGELIYLPSSSWSPFSRRRRTLSYLRETLLGDTVSNDKGIQCVEIFTRTEKTGELNHIGFIIIAITIFGIAMFIIITIVILVKFMQCCKLSSVSKSENESPDDNTGEVDISTESHNSVNDDSDIINEKLSNEAKMEDNDSGISQVVKNCINSSDHFVNSGYKASKCIHDLSKLSTETDTEEEFHPGYEIPPSSMVEVYGYDFPRPLNKYPGHPLSPAPSSCELNDQVTEFSWDKYNHDIPEKDNIKLALPKKINNSDPDLKFKKVTNRFETYQQSSAFPTTEIEFQCVRKKSRPPYNEAFRNSENGSKRAIDFQCAGESPKISNKSDFQSSPSEFYVGSHDIASKIRSIGDIIVTGGTLIEVPEGYARPATPRTASESSVLRIVVS